MWKTPSSLKWLIKKRSRVAGMVDATSQAIAEFRPQALRAESAAEQARAQLGRTEDRLAGYMSMLKSVDDALSIHEIEIDPGIIKSASIGSARFRRGELTHALIETLRNAPEQGKTTTDIALSVAFLVPGCADGVNVKALTRVVRRRLAALKRRGAVSSSPHVGQVGPRGTPSTYWALVKGSGFKPAAISDASRVTPRRPPSAAQFSLQLSPPNVEVGDLSAREGLDHV